MALWVRPTRAASVLRSGQLAPRSSLRGGPLSLCGLHVAADFRGSPELPREVRRNARAALHRTRKGESSPAMRGLLAEALA